MAIAVRASWNFFLGDMVVSVEAASYLREGGEARIGSKGNLRQAIVTKLLLNRAGLSEEASNTDVMLILCHREGSFPTAIYRTNIGATLQELLNRIGICLKTA